MIATAQTPATVNSSTTAQKVAQTPVPTNPPPPPVSGTIPTVPVTTKNSNPTKSEPPVPVVAPTTVPPPTEKTEIVEKAVKQPKKEAEKPKPKR